VDSPKPSDATSVLRTSVISWALGRSAHRVGADGVTETAGRRLMGIDRRGDGAVVMALGSDQIY
jgi:hypothetical protein